jgi:hypothetical protein
MDRISQGLMSCGLRRVLHSNPVYSNLTRDIFVLQSSIPEFVLSDHSEPAGPRPRILPVFIRYIATEVNSEEE